MDTIDAIDHVDVNADVAAYGRAKLPVCTVCWMAPMLRWIVGSLCWLLCEGHGEGTQKHAMP